MGLTNSENFEKKHNETAAYAKAMAHPARVAILELLIRRKTCICGDIVDELPLSQATISQHLRALKDAGLISGNIEGVKVCYCIDEAVWNKVSRNFNNLFASYTCCK